MPLDERIYYFDSYRTEFSGRVEEVLFLDGSYHVRLDRSAFYPTSGGQPHDTGTLSGMPVVDVYVQDGAVFHVTTQALTVGQTVIGRIDWMRRFDHMQHHTGQHILSACFEHLLDADTVGFHLGDEQVTLDIGASNLSWAQILQVEAAANQVIWDNRQIQARFVDPSELAGLNLRRQPKVDENIRIVSIEGFDNNACGGTHTLATGQVGQIKILRADKIRGDTRLTFLCGKRALHDYEVASRLLKEISNDLSTSSADTPGVIRNLQQTVSDARKREAKLEAELAEWKAEILAKEDSHQIGNLCVVLKHIGVVEHPKALQMMADKLSARLDSPGVVALMGTFGERQHVYIVCVKSERTPANQLIRTLLDEYAGKGGGSAIAAQCALNSVGETNRVLQVIERKLLDMTKGLT
jgi:alanyl-tRNA synthetase